MKADCQSKLSAINHNLRVLSNMEENVVMCGIVGYIGYDNAKELLLKGLEKLEYRGYDSALAVA